MYAFFNFSSSLTFVHPFVILKPLILFVLNPGPPWVEGSTADTSQGSRHKPATEPAMSEAAATRLILQRDSKAAGETHEIKKGCQTVPE